MTSEKHFKIYSDSIRGFLSDADKRVDEYIKNTDDTFTEIDKQRFVIGFLRDAYQHTVEINYKIEGMQEIINKEIEKQASVTRASADYEISKEQE